MPIDTTKTGAAIAACRQRMKLSQQGLASLMNVTHQAVSKWEKGLALPDTETLLALAKLFGTTMEDLLMGKLPATEEPVKPEESRETSAPAPTEAVSDLPPEDAEKLDFSAVMNMLPYVSTRVADRLFRSCTQSSQLDAGQLIALAPFVSTQALNDHLLARPLADYSPEILCSLAPFLPTVTVDALILGLDEPIPPHMIHTLMPFASSKVVDQMVLGKFGIPWEEDNSNPEGQSERSFSSQQLQDRIHQKIRRKLDAIDMNKIQQKIDRALNTASHPNSADAKRTAHQPKRESPRMRLIQKAIENGQYDLVEDCFDELDEDAHRLLLNELKETGDAQLMALFCENAAELDANTQLDLIHLLLEGRMFSELAEIIDELDEDVQHQLLDRAFEINDPELLHIISEHL